MEHTQTSDLRELEQLLRRAGISVGPHIPGVTRIGDAPVQLTLSTLKALDEESYKRGVEETIAACVRLYGGNGALSKSIKSGALEFSEEGFAELVRDEVKKTPRAVSTG